MFHEIEGESAGRLRVKICGITNEADARVAWECGADAIGLNFFRGSRRYLERNRAKEWISELPPELVKIAVVVNPTAAEAAEIASLQFISGLQLHGQETPEFCRFLLGQGVRFAKAVPVIVGHGVANASDYSTQTIVLDSQFGGVFGGSGSPFPWEIAAEFVAAHPALRVVLAGGLTPENVSAAIAMVRPFAVDVTSGVESKAGRKDHGRLRAFIATARGT